MYTPAGPQRYTPSSLPPSESVPRATPASEYSQSSQGSPGDAHAERPGSTSSQLAEHLPSFDPYYRQHQGPGIHTGSHLHPPAQISRHVPPYPTQSDSAYTWQSDGAGSGYRTLYSPRTHPSWSGTPFTDQESLHASMAQIMSEVKSLATRLTSLSEREGERNEKMDRILTRIEGIETQLIELEGAVGEGIGTRDRRSSGGSKSVYNEHPLLKVSRDMIPHLPCVLKTSACGAYNFLSDVRSRGIWE